MLLQALILTFFLKVLHISGTILYALHLETHLMQHQLYRKVLLIISLFTNKKNRATERLSDLSTVAQPEKWKKVQLDTSQLDQ